MSHWYDHAIIYQIYPKSFQDSNNDGVGDLNGIITRLPYLKALGINTIWLNPVFVSPQVDNGYDVSNYFAIDNSMGSMDDMEKLIDECHKIGIHLIMDFVLNHTSDKHPWFQDAIKNKNSIYRNYYLFAGEDNKLPNNWESFFGGSVWEKDPTGSGQFYFHLFDKHMPDLNWKNPEVRHSMLKIAKYWLNKGIDGLRLDAFIHIAKANLKQNFPSAESINSAVGEPFFANLPQVQEWLRPFCEKIKEDYPEALLLGESSSANVNLAVDYTAKSHHLMDSVVTFRYFTEDQSSIDPAFSATYQPKKIDWNKFKQTQVVWQQTLMDVAYPTLYWSNHDMARTRTRIANSDLEAKSLAMLMYLQRGLPIIYYGEELGLQNVEFSTVEQFNDQTVNSFVKEATDSGLSLNQVLKMVSSVHKLPARAVMAWNNQKFSGFSSVRPWITGRRLENNNVAEEEKDSNSMLNFYRQLLKLKKQPVFEDGDYNLLDTGQNSYVYTRQLNGENVLIAVSLSDKQIQVKLPNCYSESLLSNGKYQINQGMLILDPHAGVVLKKEN